MGTNEMKEWKKYDEEQPKKGIWSYWVASRDVAGGPVKIVLAEWNFNFWFQNWGFHITEKGSKVRLSEYGMGSKKVREFWWKKVESRAEEKDAENVKFDYEEWMRERDKGDKDEINKETDGMKVKEKPEMEKNNESDKQKVKEIMEEMGLVSFKEKKPMDGDECELWIMGYFWIKIKLGESGIPWVYYGNESESGVGGAFIQQIELNEKKDLSAFYKTRYVGVQQNVIDFSEGRREKDKENKWRGVSEEALWWKKIGKIEKIEKEEK